MSPDPVFGPLVSVAWLREHLHDPRLIVFDVRFDLNDTDAGRRQYLAGHIPGAFYLDLEKDLSAPVGRFGGRHPLPDPAELAKKLYECGVRIDSRVVVYGGGDGQMAARAWWLFSYLGLLQVAVLDGGWPAWERDGGTVQRGQESPKRTGSRAVDALPIRPRQEWIRDYAEVRRIVETRPPGIVLVDSRAPARYRGEVEPLDPVAGRIPTAVNYPFAENLREDGHWRPASELSRRFQALKDASEVVVYCGSGVSACVNILAMHIAGIERPLLYPGSWSDWCSRPGAPVATGADPDLDSRDGRDLSGNPRSR